jgi:hypothetical protein
MNGACGPLFTRHIVAGIHRRSRVAVARRRSTPVWPPFPAVRRRSDCSADGSPSASTKVSPVIEQARSPALRLAAALAVVGLVPLAACGRGEPPATLAQETQLTTIGVNSHLWRASLETLQFMPLAQVDSAGGVIVADWYQNPATPGERVKVTVAILDGALRADAVQVSAQREILENGRWVAAPVRAGTVQRLEEIILERARTMRQAAIAQR